MSSDTVCTIIGIIISMIKTSATSLIGNVIIAAVIVSSSVHWYVQLSVKHVLIYSNKVVKVLLIAQYLLNGLR